MLDIDPHPSLDLHLLEVAFPGPLGTSTSRPELLAHLSRGADAPMASSDVVRLKVRDLLRHGGFKPTGRSKPASEYLIKAADQGFLGPINLAVDVCNVVSLHSGVPISVVDLDRTVEPLRVRLADEGASYVFNASGQEIAISNLLCLHDAQGPCANAVKDSQRTKTDGDTSRCLYLFWGTRELEGRAAEATAWAATLLEAHGAQVTTHSGDL
ncbi:MAG: phenylalanine--tRNA ligase beta subunit-related protein [Myxococcota bacterium]|nr:phenylalanine--tRNA ligase beta subunit-related protein [Myxococcota bacterium]